MVVELSSAMEESLAGWQNDLPSAWQDVLADVCLGFGDMAPDLMLELWEPIFPARRGKSFPGAPPGAHLLRAFDDIVPDDVRCVVLGQDPYPEPGFATGRAFEAGNIDTWRELDKMFSKSIRAYMLLIVAARTGNSEIDRDFAQWPLTLEAVERGEIDLEPPDQIADRWVQEGVLLLNSSLTLTRFQVDPDPHQTAGHVPLWQPLILAILGHLARRSDAIVFLGFGDVAAENLRSAGLVPASPPHLTVLRAHPAFADDVLGKDNPFVLCNAHLQAAGGRAIAW